MGWGTKRPGRPEAVKEVAATTMHLRVQRGSSYRSGALGRIVDRAGRYGDTDTIIRALEIGFRLEERDRRLEYWGA